LIKKETNVEVLRSIRDSSLNTVAEVSAAVATIQQLRDNELQRRRRVATVPPHVQRLLDQQPEGCLGAFSQLGFIEDDTEAEQAARIIGAKMAALVYEKSDAMQAQYRVLIQRPNDPSVHLVSLDTMQTFRPNDEQRERMRVQPKEIPLTLVQGAPLDGFLGFLVNRMQLK
jgi:hypothetical protein